MNPATCANNRGLGNQNRRHALRARQEAAPVVFSHMGIPTRRYLVRSRYRLPMHVELAREATACTVLSQAAAERFRRYLLRDPEVIPPGVACADFEVEAERTDEPTIVFAGSAADPATGTEAQLWSALCMKP